MQRRVRPIRMGEFSARVYRVVFGAAALYNIAFGLWASIAPQAFFDIFHMDPPRYPAVWACLGMVVGLYGAGYAYAAWRLDRAVPFIAIGLAGKILGPIGWVIAVRSHELPFRTFPLIVFDDLMWWLPFAFFLIDSVWGRASARLGVLKHAATPYICAGVHLVAAIATVTLRPRAYWLIWMITAQTLLGFYAWWGSRVAPRLATVAFAIAVAGIFCDYAGESMFITLRSARIASLLTGGAANALYTIAGATLTIASPWLRRPVRAWAWLVWICGAALTAVTIAASTAGIMISSAALMVLFVPWVIAVAVTSP